jgi:hypothetical protein
MYIFETNEQLGSRNSATQIEKYKSKRGKCKGGRKFALHKRMLIYGP